MITIIKSKELKEKPADESKLGFGRIFTDHMFTLKYEQGKGWHDPTIQPYSKIEMDPSTSILHYGQTIFEGLKAYRVKDGRILLFRPRDNFLRLNRSADRMCIPNVDVDLALEGLFELLKVEKDWVPSSKGTSLYIRPTIIATEPYLGVHVSTSYLFYMILSPVGAYYSTGLKPVSIYVEDQYVRAAKGGTGEAKTAGNYAASLIGSKKAEQLGCSQVLWLDAAERKYVEEVGAMNIFFVIDGVIVTPALSGSILPGITRDSVIKYARFKGLEVQECAISIDEVEEAYEKGKLDEAFGTGTAAVISPVGVLKYKDKTMVINNGEMGKISAMMYDGLTGIQNAELPDPFGWVIELK
ncbi:MAG TPA: branched-chain amino acid aminotransferase [Clostridia bacterium]|nr:branched-chain amino acid aminotransferase [Clostridia bacterium]